MARILTAMTTIAILAAMLACAGAGGSGGTNANLGTVTPGAAGQAILTMGDAPLDRVVAFEVTLTSLVLTNSSGANVTALSTPARVEVSHLSGTFSPLTRISVPQGTYTRATATFSRPEITFLDANGTLVEQEPPLTTSTVSVALSPPLVIGDNAVSINLDLNLAQSVAFDAAGRPSVTPAIAVGNAMVTPGDASPLRTSSEMLARDTAVVTLP